MAVFWYNMIKNSAVKSQIRYMFLIG
jgi:hypothetical protein